MNAEDVDISPSRENILWTDKTREAVTTKFNKVVDIASKEVEKQLKEEDFIKWLEKCSRVLSYNDSSSILGRLSRVIDKSAIKPTYPLDKSIKFKNPKEMLYGVSIREVYTQNNGWGTKTKVDIKRDDLTSWNTLQSYKIYYTEGTANSLKDRYITHTQSGRFILLQIPEALSEEEYRKGAASSATKENVDDMWKEYSERHINIAKLVNLIKSSKESINYDELVVPEDFKKKLEDSEKVEADGTIIANTIPELTPAEKRKLDERTILYYPQKSTYDINTNTTITNSKGQTLTIQRRHNWIKSEPKISDVLAWEGTIIYGFEDDKEMLLTVAWIIEQQTMANDGKTPLLFSDDVKIVKVAQGIKKYFKGHTHVTEFFKKVDGTELSMNNLFVNWYTGKRIADGLVGFEFLNGFEMFNQEVYDKYKELRTFEVANYKDLSQYTKYGNMLGCTPDAFNAITDYADEMAQIQIDIDKDPSGIYNELTAVHAIDLDKYKLLQEVVEYATPLKGILNYITPLTKPEAINFELESEIKEIMRNKGYDS